MTLLEDVFSPLSFEEYLALDASAPDGVRYEYDNGAIFAMTGGTRRHSLVAANAIAALVPLARARGCRVHTADARLWVPSIQRSYHPDVMVVCSPPPTDPRYETSPCLVIEVLSPSTSQTDRREKRAAYLKVPELMVYVLIDPESPDGSVEVMRRAGDLWFNETLDADASITIPCLDTTLAVREFFVDLV